MGTYELLHKIPAERDPQAFWNHKVISKNLFLHKPAGEVSISRASILETLLTFPVSRIRQEEPFYSPEGRQLDDPERMAQFVRFILPNAKPIREDKQVCVIDLGYIAQNCSRKSKSLCSDVITSFMGTFARPVFVLPTLNARDEIQSLINMLPDSVVFGPTKQNLNYANHNGPDEE
ncbi:hypothetical protein Ciccas_005120 [Cichlidogyrus casuarinus]|uniref:Uncharacterized protein n=1 Tax=Cichlidogyrus casuarinus TaxID=1844966 RepID=A0ABD2QAH1_9PLAT